jgi:predicted AlkP superfamily pyrophosphatase or phosphodiesterase
MMEEQANRDADMLEMVLSARIGRADANTQPGPPGHRPAAQPGVPCTAHSRTAALRRGTAPKRVVAWLCAIAFAALSACSPAPTKRDGYSPLILISFDGYRADYIERGLSPNLSALARDGVHAQALRPAFPTLTFPNHYTIATGLYPDHHGIVHNRMIDPVSGKRFVYSDPKTTGDPSWWGGEPLWVSVERQGKHASTMFWPGADVAIGNVRPDHWKTFDARMSPDARVDQALAWLDLPSGQRPDFVTLYFERIDHEAHEHGPDSEGVDAALREMDAALGRLLDGLKQRGLDAAANLVIVSDHGGTASGLDKVVLLDDIVDVGDIDLINAGVLAEFAPKAGHEAQVERAVLQPHDHARCWRKSEVPPRLHYGTNARIPPLLCLADDGWLINTRAYMHSPKRKISNGEHGYDNDDPKMRALFVAHGPAFRRGLVVPEFDNVDVYPLLAHVLGIQAQPNDGNYDEVKSMLVRP